MDKTGAFQLSPLPSAVRLAFFSSLSEPVVQLQRNSSGAASLLHANAAAAPGACLCKASRAAGSRASRRTTCEFRAFFVGGADLPGAGSHFADTLLGLRLLCLACAP